MVKAMRFTRRQLIAGAATGAAGVLSGCYNTPIHRKRFVDNCTAVNSDPTLRIDVHCHVMNARDANQGDFLARRKVKSDDVAVGELVEQAASGIVRIVDPDYTSARREANNLLNAVRKRDANLTARQATCRQGLPGIFDLFASDDGTQDLKSNVLGDGRAIGFGTSRT